MAVGVRVFFVGLVLSVLLALFATGTSRNFTQEFLKSEAVELLSDFPELEVQVDGRDMTLSGVPQRRHGDGLAEALQRVSTLYGVRTFSNLISTKDLEEPAAVIIKDEDLAGLARFTPSDFQVVKLETGSVIDFAAAIQVAVMPEWTPDEGDDPCLLSLGDTLAVEYAICISGNRKNITLKNDDDFQFLPYDFTLDQPYFIEVETNDSASLIKINGQTLGSLPIGIKGISSQRLNIATLDGVSSSFTGRLGRIRLWNRGSLDGLPGIHRPWTAPEAEVEVVEPGWHQPTWQPSMAGFTPYFDNLVASSKLQDDGKLVISVESAKLDAAGSWSAVEEQVARRLVVQDIADDHPEAAWAKAYLKTVNHGNYSSYKVVQFERDLDDGSLVLRSDAGGLSTVWANREWSDAVRFQRISETVYRADTKLTQAAKRRGQFSELVVAGTDNLQLDGSLFLQPFQYLPPTNSDQKLDAWNSTFVNPEQIKNYFYSFAGYDITKMDPVNFGDVNGVRAAIFTAPRQSSTDYKSTGEGRYLPGSLFFKPIFSAESENTVQITNSETELRSSLAQSLGVSVGAKDVGNFSASIAFSTKKSKLSALNYQHGFGESRVLHYALVQDKARMELETGFRDAVAGLLIDDGTEPAVQKSIVARNAEQDFRFDEFLRRFGTHYTYATTYGGKVHVELRKTLRINKSTVDRETEFKLGAKASIDGAEFGADFSQTTGSGRTVGTENGMEVTQVVVVGGRGTASLEHLEIQDTVVPIYMDLRPISDLLSPLYFSDPAITDGLRKQLAAKILEYRKKGDGLLDQSDAVRVAVRISRITCIDDGDRTLEVSPFAFAGANLPVAGEGGFKKFLTKVTDAGKALVKPLFKLGSTIAGDLGLPTVEMLDQAETCEFRGFVAAAATRQDNVIDPVQIGKGDHKMIPARPMPFDKDTIAKAKSAFAYWHAGEPTARATLDVAEDSSIVPTEPNSELLIVLPKQAAGGLPSAANTQLSLVVSLEEVDDFRVVQDERTQRHIRFRLPLSADVSLPLNGPLPAHKTVVAKLREDCRPDRFYACGQSPYAKFVEGEVHVEFEIEKIN
jgi:hypothetical protein